MIWRKSLSARVAIATAGMLSLVLLLLCASAYGLTAWLLRQGVDMALMTALPMQSREMPELLARAHEFERRDPGARLVQVVTYDGQPEGGRGQLPIDPRALEEVRRQRAGFSSVAPVDGQLTVRTGPPA